MAVGDEQHVVLARDAELVGQPPRAVGALPGTADGGLEADAVAQAEVIDIRVEVLGDLRVVREVRIGLRHREVRVLHALARGVDVQVAVGRRHPVAVAEDPIASDAIGGLEAVELDPALQQRLRGGNAGGAGTDDRGGGERGHGAVDAQRAIGEGDAGVTLWDGSDGGRCYGRAAACSAASSRRSICSP
jgi:hypothetical protein